MLSHIVLLFVVPILLSLPVAFTGRQLYAAVPFTYTTYLSPLIFFTLAYRLSPFHPLSKYPGPITARMSKWWGAYVGAKGDMHRRYKRLHDRYGNVVRIGWARLRLVVYQRLTISRSQRAIHSRCFLYSSHTWPRWPAQRTTCVHLIPHSFTDQHVIIRLGCSHREAIFNFSA
jgi:hypothetical protein